MTLTKAVKTKYGGNYSAVIRYGVNVSAVNVFPFLAVTSWAETVKPKHGDLFIYFPSHLKADGPHSILPVVTKDLPIFSGSAI